MIQNIDTLLFPILGLLSVVLMFRLSLRGLFLSFFIIWLVPYMWGSVLLSAVDTTRSSFFDHVWLLFGWIASLAWCLLVFLTSKGVRKFKKHYFE